MISTYQKNRERLIRTGIQLIKSGANPRNLPDLLAKNFPEQETGTIKYAAWSVLANGQDSDLFQKNQEQNEIIQLEKELLDRISKAGYAMLPGPAVFKHAVYFIDTSED